MEQHERIIAACVDIDRVSKSLDELTRGDASFSGTNVGSAADERVKHAQRALKTAINALSTWAGDELFLARRGV